MGIFKRLKNLEQGHDRYRPRYDDILRRLNTLERDTKYYDQYGTPMDLSNVVRAVVNYLGVGFKYQHDLLAVKNGAMTVDALITKYSVDLTSYSNSLI